MSAIVFQPRVTLDDIINLKALFARHLFLEDPLMGDLSQRAPSRPPYNPSGPLPEGPNALTDAQVLRQLAAQACERSERVHKLAHQLRDQLIGSRPEPPVTGSDDEQASDRGLLPSLHAQLGFVDTRVAMVEDLLEQLVTSTGSR